MLQLILDFETTGLDPSAHEVIEIGALVFDHSCPKLKIVDLFSCLVKNKKSLCKQAQDVNQIFQKEINLFGLDPQLALELLWARIEACEHLIAHNAEFDRSFLIDFIDRYGSQEKKEAIKQKVWFCTKEDLNTPPRLSLKKLCAMYKVENVSAHRALADCLSLWQVLKNRRALREKQLILPTSQGLK